MATSYPTPQRLSTDNHRIFYELAERSPLLTPYTGDDPVVLSCIAAMRKETESFRRQAEASQEEAIPLLTKALAIHCDRPQLYLQRGLAYWRKGDIEAMEVDMSTALALDSSSSTAVAHFFRALGRVKCGHLSGAQTDLLDCVDKMGWNSKAGICATQEFHYVETLLTRQRRYCDAAAVAAAAEACAAREARGAALAKEARAQGSLVRRQWRTRMVREQRAAAAHQAKAPEEITDIPAVLRINTKAKSCASPVQSPRSVVSWPVSSAPSSPPDSSRQADVAPAQQCLTAGDARAEAALQQWEEYSAILCQQRKAMPVPAAAADKTLTLLISHKETMSDLPESPRSVASWPASSAPSSPLDSPRQADRAPVKPATTSADVRALAALQQWEQYSAFVCQQRAAAAADDACYETISMRAVGCSETDARSEVLLSPRPSTSSLSDSPRHADVAPDQPSASSAPEQPAAAPAEHESAAEADASPSPVCLCMHEDGATKVLTPLQRYRCAVSRHPCCSCGRYCKPSDGQQHNPDILAALATMKKEAEVYLRQLKASQPHPGTDSLQPSSHEQSALSLATAGANQDGCGATSIPQPRPTSAADSSCAPAEAACKKKEKKKGKKRKGHCRRA